MRFGAEPLLLPRSVDVYVRRLREKIEKDPEQPQYFANGPRSRLPLRCGEVKQRIFFKLLLVFLLVIIVATVTLDLLVRRSSENSLRARSRSLLCGRKWRCLPTGWIANPSLSAEARRVGQPGGGRSRHHHRPARQGNRGLQRRAGLDGEPRAAYRIPARPSKAELEPLPRKSATVGVEYLYVAAPVRGGAVRLAYPLQAIQEARRRIRYELLFSSLLAFLVAMVVAALYVRSISTRLRRMVGFRGASRAGRPFGPAGQEHSADEIGAVAHSLDATTKKLQENFEALQTSRDQLETLLNSMQEAVVAVNREGRVQWANRRMEKLLPTGVRPNAAVVETIREPNFLATIQTALHRSQCFHQARVLDRARQDL